MKKLLKLSLFLTCLSVSLINASQANPLQVPTGSAAPDLKALSEVQAVAGSQGKKGAEFDMKYAVEGVKTLITTKDFQRNPKGIPADKFVSTCRESLKAQLVAAGVNPTEAQSRTFNNESISRDTLARLVSAAPQQVEQQVVQWLTANNDFVKTALGNEFMIGTVRPCHEKTWELMKTKGLVNLSQCNYVFQVPGTDYVMQVAGHVNRKENMKRLAAHLAGANYEWGKPLTEENWLLFQKSLAETEMDKVTGKKKELVVDVDANANKKVVRISHMPKTYQTVSRAAAAVLLNEVAKRRQFKYVVVPETHLVHIPGRPQDVSDRNFVTIQRIEKDVEDVVVLTPSEETEVITILREIGLFGCNKGSLKRRKSDGKLVLLDLEQPNNSNPLDFFHRNFAKFVENGDAGMWDYISNYVAQK